MNTVFTSFFVTNFRYGKPDTSYGTVVIRHDKLKYFQVKKARGLQKKIENNIVLHTNEANDKKFRWWSDFVFKASSNTRLEQNIMDRVQNDLRNYQNPAIETYNTRTILKHFVTTILF